MKIICIILARKESKRIINKNLLIFNKYPLIYSTLKQALRIKKVSKIILSTDCDEIIKISKKISKKFIINKRSKKLSGSKTRSETVIKYLGKIYKFDAKDYILILQPTSPLRKDKDITKAINIATEHNLKTIHSGNIYHKKIKIKQKIYLYNNRIKKIIYSKKNYSYNGAIYLFRYSYFVEKKTIYEKTPNIYKMNNKDSLDIDTYKDIKNFDYKVYKSF